MIDSSPAPLKLSLETGQGTFHATFNSENEYQFFKSAVVIEYLESLRDLVTPIQAEDYPAFAAAAYTMCQRFKLKGTRTSIFRSLLFDIEEEQSQLAHDYVRQFCEDNQL